MKFLACVLGLALSAFVFLSQPVFATPSGDVVIMQVQAFGNGVGTDSSYEEFVLLYNHSAEDINIMGWCLNYSSASGSTTTELECINAPDLSTEIWIESEGYTSFATSEFVQANPDFVPDFMFSRKLSNTSGHIWLTDIDGVEIDRVGWGDAVLPEGFSVSIHDIGEVLSRDLLATDIDTNVNSVDFNSQPIISPIASGLYEKEVLIDLCANLEGIQTKIPSGYIKIQGQEICEEENVEDSVLIITELLPNAPSYDTGLEFIEIYNPNNTEIQLKDYRLQLGLSYSKEYVFTSGVIQPGEYLVFSDTETGIILPNSSSSSIRLIAPAGNTVSETGVYSNADDDVSWAVVSDKWIYTNQITPGSANKPYLLAAEDDVLGETSVLAPCPAGKYRNPETNRCKNIETAVSTLVPCGPGEYRNPETNRCKKLSSSSSSLEPCPEGQERNPETNRCRKVSVLGTNTDLPAVTDIVVESSEGQLNWPVILLSLGGVFSYMIYEWRNELIHHYRRLRLR